MARDHSAELAVGGWWLPWIVGGVISSLADNLAKEVNDIGSLIMSSQLQMVADVLFAIAGVFAIVLVTMLQKRVLARASKHRR